MITRRRFGALAAGAAIAAVAKSAHAAPKSRSTKRGVCFITGPDSDWQTRVEALKPSWMYSWGARRPKELAAEIDFTPMMWGGGSEEKVSAKLEILREAIARGEVNHLLGFNEPDQKEQSNMSVERVVELWPRLMELDVPLISPGCVHPDREWMREFMEQVDQKQLRVDAIAVHSYGGPDPVHMMRRLARVYQEFGRPIWITEFAVGDWKAKKPEQNRHKPSKIAKYMREILPALEEAPFVERYAWFSASPKSGPLGTSALLDEKLELTQLGRIYAAV